MDLNKCPACGERAYLKANPRNRGYVECDACHMRGPDYEAHERAIEAWNKLVMVHTVVEVEMPDVWCPANAEGACQVGPCEPGVGFLDCEGPYKAPDWCKLRQGPVVIRAREE